MNSKSAKMEPRWAQDRSKIVPRSFWIAFFPSSIFVSFFDRFRLRFGAVWGAKMDPKSGTKLPGGGPWGVQGGLGLVLVRSFVRLVARCCFLDPLALPLGPFWDVLGSIFGHLRPSWGLSWALLGPSWANFEPSWALLGQFWCHLGLSWGYLGPLFGSAGLFWDSLGGAFGKFGAPRTSATQTMAWPGGLREAIKSAAPWAGRVGDF